MRAPNAYETITESLLNLWIEISERKRVKYFITFRQRLSLLAFLFASNNHFRVVTKNPSILAIYRAN